MLDLNDKELMLLLTERQVSRVTSISVGTLRRRRAHRLPPVFLKLGHAIRYDASAVLAWLEASQTHPRISLDLNESKVAREFGICTAIFVQ